MDNYKRMIRYHIGIDPDIDKNGVCVWDKKEKKFHQLETLNFWDTIFVLEGYRPLPFTDDEVMIRISAGWLIDKTMWHKPDANRHIQQKIAMNVGLNHAAGRLIEQWCIRNDMPYKLVKPSGKVDAKTFKKITKWEGRTNQDTRDAAMIVYGL